MNIKFKFLITVGMITGGLSNASMVSRRIAPTSRMSSTTIKAAQSLFTVPTIAPVSINKTSSFYTVTPNSFKSSSGTEQTKKSSGRKAIPLSGRKMIPLLGIVSFYKMGDILMNKYSNKSEIKDIKQKLFAHSDDLAVEDPEMYEVCLQIMKDYGIREHLNFRVKHSNVNLDFEQDYSPENKSRDLILPAYNYVTMDTIVFSPFYKIYKKAHLIQLIAHELEHTRQFYKYPGSYHGDFNNINDIRKIEQAADAASLDYQYCPECLLSQTSQNRLIILTMPYEPEETDYGYFTSKKGYFTIPDYNLYANRDDCKTGDSRCLAHRYHPDAYMRYDLPLKLYLPTIKPSLPTAKFSDQ